MARCFFSCAFILFFFAGLGCSGTERDLVLEYNAAQFVDGTLPGEVEVLMCAEKRTREQGWLLYAILRNHTSEPVWVEGRAVFYDQFHRVSDGPKEWKLLFLEPHSSGTFHDYTMLERTANFYRMEFRLADEPHDDDLPYMMHPGEKGVF